MHKKNNQRWLLAKSLSVILAVLFGGLASQSGRALSSNPNPVCVATTCTVTFEASGDYYLWSPPEGAKNISFDLMGAQGGRLGGLGGRVTGMLAAVPAALYIYVGGAGSQGARAQGGFNGGGDAGNGRGDEGSGGGATDIRSSTSINDRIAVAGGGGGSGGYNGGPGGSAGGQNAVPGTTGQGQGGAGATKSAGGNGGSPNGGSRGGNGDFGLGGAGGSSTISGGGGGGGGYYGGGGGGADVDPVGSNAGGGGGGSSWSHPVQATSVTNTGGYREGAGVAIISYVVPPSVTSFLASRNLTNETQISYALKFNESVSGLASDDFVTTGSTTTCSEVLVSGSDKDYEIRVVGCEHGTLKLTLLANSVSGVLAGPQQDQVAADVVVDRAPPTAMIEQPPSPNSAATINYSLQFSEAVTGLERDDFVAVGLGCEVGPVSGAVADYVIQLINCTDGASAQLNLLANSVSDLASNPGPATAAEGGQVLIDRSAPIGSWVTKAETSNSSANFELHFTEKVTGLTAGDFYLAGSATNCLLIVTETVTGSKFAIEINGCSAGTIQVVMNANSYADELGNSGPVNASGSAIVTKAALPLNTASPVAAPPVASSPVASSPVVSLAPSEPAPSPPATDQPAQLVGISNEANQTKESEFEVAPDSGLANQSQITVQNPTAAKPFAVVGNNWINVASVVAGALAIGVACVGLIKVAGQMRSRRLVRKFT